MITAPGINPGRFDRRLILLERSVTRSATGAALEQWVAGDTVWAQWLPRSSREFIAAQARHAETTGVFRIRHRGDIAATWRLAASNDLFRLAGDPIEVGRREYLDLPVTALDQSPADITTVHVCLLHDSSYELLHDSSYALLHTAAA